MKSTSTNLNVRFSGKQQIRKQHRIISLFWSKEYGDFQSGFDLSPPPLPLFSTDFHDSQNRSFDPKYRKSAKKRMKIIPEIYFLVTLPAVELLNTIRLHKSIPLRAINILTDPVMINVDSRLNVSKSIDTIEDSWYTYTLLFPKNVHSIQLA